MARSQENLEAFQNGSQNKSTEIRSCSPVSRLLEFRGITRAHLLVVTNLAEKQTPHWCVFSFTGNHDLANKRLLV